MADEPEIAIKSGADIVDDFVQGLSKDAELDPDTVASMSAYTKLGDSQEPISSELLRKSARRSSSSTPHLRRRNDKASKARARRISRCTFFSPFRF
jgi:hypothetical protein